MIVRYCRDCSHRDTKHWLVDDSRNLFVRDACKVGGCTCRRYNFDYERWIRADERLKLKQKKRQK